MEKRYNIEKVNIPYGVLHDQKLICVKSEKNKLIFKFEIEVYEDDYPNPEIFNMYKNFKYCDMEVEMDDEPWNYFRLETCPDKHGKYKGISLNREDFLKVINNSSETTFIECSSTYGEFHIELCVDYYHSKKAYRKLKKYDMCRITIDAKNVTWTWY